MSHEKAVARSSRDSCLSGCQRLGAKDYAACEMRCRLEAAVSDWDSHDHDHDGIVDHDSEDHHSDSSGISLHHQFAKKLTNLDCSLTNVQISFAGTKHVYTLHKAAKVACFFNGVFIQKLNYEGRAKSS